MEYITQYCLRLSKIDTCGGTTIYFINVYKYIHNSSLQRFRQYYDLASVSTYVVCVNFIHDRWDLWYKVDFERHFFEKLFMAILFNLTVLLESRLLFTNVV